VDGKAQGEHCARLQVDLRTSELDSLPHGILIGFELVPQHVLQESAAPFSDREKIVGLGEALKPSHESGPCVLIARLSGALRHGCHRLNGRERVLDPVVELVQQDRLPFVVPSALGDVMGDADHGEAAVGADARAPADTDPADALVRPDHAVLHLEIDPVRRGLGDGLRLPLPVIGMNGGDQIRIGEWLVAKPSEIGAACCRSHQLAGRQVVFP